MQDKELLLAIETVAQKITTEYSGPLPPPNFMREYADIDLEIPKTIMRMAEKSLNTNCALMEKEQDFSHKRYIFANLSSVIVILTFVFLGAFLVFFDKDAYAYCCFGASSISAFFGYRNIFKNKVLKENHNDKQIGNDKQISDNKQVDEHIEK